MAKKAKAPKKEEPVKGAPKGKPGKGEEVDESLRGIVRIAGKDIKGHVPLKRALLRVRGFGHTTAKIASEVISQELGISPDTKSGSFSDEQIEKIDAILTSIHKRNVPRFLLNRQKDFDSGEDMHVIMNDLIFAIRQDIEKEKKLYTWKGYRHAYGQKVRGQRTKNTGRKGMALGVLRKSLQQQAAAAKSAGGAESKPAEKKEKK